MKAKMLAVQISKQPLVVCGPSGVGKVEIVQELVRRFPESLAYCVSHTTREPRKMETNGVDYFFTRREVMEAEIKAGKFVEWVEIRGDLYGTSRMALQQIADEGKTAILDIDPEGVRQVKKAKLLPKPKFVFISPPGGPAMEGMLKSLEERLRGRDMEDYEKTMQRRIRHAKLALLYAAENDGANFDFTVVNYRLIDTVDILVNKLQNEWVFNLRPLAQLGEKDTEVVRLAKSLA